MLSKVHFTSVEIRFGKTFLILLKKIFSAGWHKSFPRAVVNICEKFFSKKVSIFFQTLEKVNLADLIRTAFNSCRGTFLETKVLETFVNYRKLSSNTVSRCYKVCVSRLQRKFLWDNLRINLNLFCCCSSMKRFGEKLKLLKIFERNIFGCFPVFRDTFLARIQKMKFVKFVKLGAQTF